MSEMAPLQIDPVGAELDAANREFVDRFNAGDIAGAVNGVYTGNARLLPADGGVVQGREAIVGFWEGARKQLGLRSVALEVVERSAAGGFVFEAGRAFLNLAEGQQVEDRYAVIWKQEAGRWCWDVDILNMHP
jgi:ketosteroid isomerase-like protein